MNKKRIILISLVFAIFFVITLFLFLIEKFEGNKLGFSKNNENKLILYYGNGCPHCALVEEFIRENNVLAKLNLEEKEIYYNKENAKELTERAKFCKINESAIGVPFLWDGKNCIIGDAPIIDFLKAKLN